VLKQQVLDLQADAMSTHYLASNQLRLWLAAFGTAVGTAPDAGLPRNRTGAGHRWNDPAETIESGCASNRERAAGARAIEQRVCPDGFVPALSLAPDGPGSSQRLKSSHKENPGMYKIPPGWRSFAFSYTNREFLSKKCPLAPSQPSPDEKPPRSLLRSPIFWHQISRIKSPVKYAG